MNRLLIIQCESANENTELLDSVRYILQRESSERASGLSHTLLLLNLPRGCPFNGHQGIPIQPYHLLGSYELQLLISGYFGRR